MSQERKEKILSTVLLFILLATISFSYNTTNQKSDAFAQGADTAGDLGSGPIPEDNSTDLGTGVIPEDNSTNPLGEPNIDNVTGSQAPTSTPAIPEFGSLAPIILVIAISSIILFRTKFAR